MGSQRIFDIARAWKKQVECIVWGYEQNDKKKIWVNNLHLKSIVERSNFCKLYQRLEWYIQKVFNEEKDDFLY